eukprot:403363713
MREVPDGARFLQIVPTRHQSNQFTNSQTCKNQLEQIKINQESLQYSLQNQTFFDRRFVQQRDNQSLSRKNAQSSKLSFKQTPKTKENVVSYQNKYITQNVNSNDQSQASTNASSNLQLPEIGHFNFLTACQSTKASSSCIKARDLTQQFDFQKLLNIEKQPAISQPLSNTYMAKKRYINASQLKNEIQLQNENEDNSISNGNSNEESKVHRLRKNLHPLKSNNLENYKDQVLVIISKQSVKKLSAQTMATHVQSSNIPRKTLEQVSLEAMDKSAEDFLRKLRTRKDSGFSLSSPNNNRLQQNELQNQKENEDNDNQLFSYSHLKNNDNKFQNTVQTVDRTTEIKTLDFLAGHNIKDEYRTRMVDWMIQVYRVLRVQNPQTFFLSISLMDRYFEAKKQINQFLDKKDLHLIGLVSVLISSKYEDVYPIRMSQILQDAGHNKYSQQDVLNGERDFLTVFKFKIQSKNLYEESAIMLKQIILQFKKSELSQKDLEIMDNFHLFLCQLIVHDYNLILESLEVLVPSIVYLVLKYLIKFLMRQQLLNKVQSGSPKKRKTVKIGSVSPQASPDTNSGLESSIRDFRSLLKYHKIHNIYHQENEKQIRQVKKGIIHSYLNFKEMGFRNLEKNFSHFFDLESQSLFSEYQNKTIKRSQSKNKQNNLNQ